MPKHEFTVRCEDNSPKNNNHVLIIHTNVDMSTAEISF